MRDSTNDLVISVVTIWEVSIKFGLGKLSLSLPFRDWMLKAIQELDASPLPITVEYADAQSALPQLHRDPFDRMLAAQARVETSPS